ncbi:MAG: ATP-binding protein [Candidatus Micrarchaeia archaeon]
MEIERQNPHWEDGFAYPYGKKRQAFESLWRSSKSGHITAIYGLRRVGKSVLLKQLINEAIQSGAERRSVLYFSFDEEKPDFWDVLHEFEKIQGRKADAKSWLFFDEVQKVPDWRAKIKVLYDTSFARIFISGSNSSGIRKGGESLAGRINEFCLPELSFREFLEFRGKGSLPSSGMERAAELEFLDYARRPFPETVLNRSLDPKEYASSIARKIIFEDLASSFPIDEPELLNTLFLLVCKSPGMLLDYGRIASDLGRNRKTISLYMDYLCYGFLARKLFNFSPNMLSSEKKLKKFYPSLAAFCDCDEPRFMETAMAQCIKPEFFWRHKDRFEVDFVAKSPLAAFELKYSNLLSSSDWTGLRKFKAAFPRASICMISKKPQKNAVPYYMVESILAGLRAPRKRK